MNDQIILYLVWGIFFFVVERPARDNFTHIEISSFNEKGLQNLGICSAHKCTAFEHAGVVVLQKRSNPDSLFVWVLRTSMFCVFPGLVL